MFLKCREAFYVSLSFVGPMLCDSLGFAEVLKRFGPTYVVSTVIGCKPVRFVGPVWQSSIRGLRNDVGPPDAVGLFFKIEAVIGVAVFRPVSHESAVSHNLISVDRSVRLK
jgi:hypothetical protein